MNAVFKKATLAAAAIVLLAGAPLVSQAEELKIGYVNVERILATPAKAIDAKIEQEFSRRQKDLQDLAARVKAAAEKLDKDGPVLSDADRVKRQREIIEMDKDFQRRQRELREDVTQRRNEEIGAMLEKTKKVIKQLAEAEKYDIIVEQAVYQSPRVDITDKVLKALNGK